MSQTGTRTRSGKTYSFSCCAKSCTFCQETTHVTYQCNHESLQRFHQKTIQATIFSDIVAGRSDFFLKIWLHSHTLKKLHALGPYSARSLVPNLRYDNRRSKEKQVQELTTFYREVIVSDLLTANQVETLAEFDKISEETLIEFQTLFLQKMNLEHRFLLEHILYQLRPSLKRFNITVTIIKNMTSTSVIKNEDKDKDQCPICLSNNLTSENEMTTNCNHSFCNDCLTQHINSFKEKERAPNCPCCRATIKAIRTSSKTNAEYYRKYICRDSLNHPPAMLPIQNNYFNVPQFVALLFY